MKEVSGAFYIQLMQQYTAESEGKLIRVHVVTTAPAGPNSVGYKVVHTEGPGLVAETVTPE